MRVVWLNKAKLSLRQTNSYIKIVFGNKRKEEFQQEVNHIGMLLSQHPHLGAPEPFLADRPLLYRSVVVGHLNKIVYRVLDDRIEIVDFWDTRREPQAQAGQVKE